MASDHDCVPRDSVDALLDSWHERRPELDFAPVGVLARLARVRGHVDAALEAVFRAHDLSPASFAVLAALARIGGGPGVSQRRLMQELGLTSGTISVRMDRLVDSGLVDRRPDPQSGRNTLITLTDRGRELADRVIPAHVANEQRLLAALTGDERDTLAALLRKLLVEFEGSRPPADARFRLGLTVAPAHVTIALRESVGLPPAAGLLVRAVEDGGAAAAAGIGTGDVLLRAGRCDLRSVAGLHTAIEDAVESGTLELTILRGVEEHRFTLGLREGGVAATAGRGAHGQHSV